MELRGVRTRPGLFKLRGFFNGHWATLLIDSGASAEFIDPAFARRCGLTLTKSGREIRLADGTLVLAQGSVLTPFSLAATRGDPIAFSATFTATPLDEGYDAILGMTWLAEHEPEIGWRQRSLTVRVGPAKSPRTIKPLENLDKEGAAAAHIATLSLNGLRKALRRSEVETLAAVIVRPQTAGQATAAVGAKEHPTAEALLKEFADTMPDELPPVDGSVRRPVVHRIELKPGARPPQARPLKHQSAKDLEVLEEYTRTMLASGQIRASTSPFGSVALIVKKKDGTPRVVIDYRALNEVTVKDKYPLPLMDELFDRVHGAQWFTKIDLRSGFHQILVEEQDIHKTAFRTRYGSFEYVVLPMGLCNAPSTFMRLMNETFRDLLDKSVLVFLDDILVFSKTEAEHAAHVREVLMRLRANKLYAKRSKCEFFRKEVEFLGHRIGAEGLAVSQDKVESVRTWQRPKDVSDVRSFLGLAGFYRRFVKDYSKIALPLTELTKEAVGFRWGDAQQAAFDALKDALSSAPVLVIADPALPFTVNCDACDYAVGATLQQDHGRGLQPVAFRSRKLTPAEVNYDTRKKEFLALVDACSHWRHYLHSGIPFTLLTDHDSLKYHKTMPNISGQLARWIEKMAEFDYTIAHIAGEKNVVADALSRRSDYKNVPEQPADTAAAAQLAPGRARPLARFGDMTYAEAATQAERLRNKAAAEETKPPAPDRPLPNKHGVIVMPTQRCTADTQAGTHCKQRTARGQYCWNHLAAKAGLRIKKSDTPGAGMGLFASRTLPGGHDIAYSGDLVPLDTDSDGGVYYLGLTTRVAVDAARTNAGPGRWVNDPRGSDKRANAAFVVHTPRGQPRRASVRTLRPIERGEEILVAYGNQYWRYHAKSKKERPRKNDARLQADAEPAGAQSAPRLQAAGTGRKTGQRDDAPLQASLLTEARPTSDLMDRVRAAAQKNEKYQACLRKPPAGYSVRQGLLWLGPCLGVPGDEPLRTSLMAECHDAVTGAHFGRDKTLAALKARVAWPGMAADVDRYVSSCDACQRNKPSQQAPAGLLMPLPLPERPCREWTQDAVTGLPRTKRGHDAIQVYVERLCKLKHFAAARATDGAPELAASFVHAVVRPHGVPEAIVSDRDPRFTAKFYQQLTQLMGITLRMSTARHPQTDGQSEREIRTLVTALRAFCNDHQDDWDDYLDMLELGFNCTPQASTKHSPYELLYGEQPRLPLDAALDAGGCSATNPAALTRAQRMQQAMSFAREHLLSAQARQKRNADQHRRGDGYAAGDLVLLSVDGIQLAAGHNKLASRYLGPFSVTERINANAYRLDLPPQMAALHPVFNISKLKRYRDGEALYPSRPQRYDRPPPAIVADSNGDEEWHVESVLKERRRGRGKQYLVRWRGYPPEEDTWEPAAALKDTAALDAYEQSLRSSAARQATLPAP